MTLFIAYYRVSTDRQGASGLGLDAQRAAVFQHTGTGQLAAEYTEIESGKKQANSGGIVLSFLCDSSDQWTG
jgi:DNA invertase Pin-like site-specific DNA recombinase